jgi:hypothetical protein
MRAWALLAQLVAAAFVVTAQQAAAAESSPYDGWRLRILEPTHGTTLPSMAVTVRLSVTGPPGVDASSALVCLSLSGRLPPTCVAQQDLHLTAYEGVHALTACVVFPDGTSCFDRTYNHMQVWVGGWGLGVGGWGWGGGGIPWVYAHVCLFV